MRFAFAPAPLETSARLQEELGVPALLADVLVRRGLADAASARAFLDLRGPQHDPFELGEMEAACVAIERVLAAGRRIVVHGDYDVDGICATALLVTVLGRLGGDAVPFLPSRFEEGYGLAVETVERLAAAGTGLLVTVDCGVTAVEAAARAAELGLPLVISDHHQPAAELPACPLVAVRGRGADYPAELCGTGVAFKLAQALVSRAGAPVELLDEQLELVALATVADVVPLIGENRGLARAGLDALRRTRRVGLEALMRVAGVERTTVGAGEIAFRLAPRINAAGRLGHPREALELLSTDDPLRARQLADTLEARNRERQAVEAEILRQALGTLAALPAERREARGLVLASAEWHVGVVGIVAARLAERLARPVVLIALDGDEGRGSGRSIPAFDLHGALQACAEHLVAYGGHRAAAGVTIHSDEVEGFAAAFAAHAAATLTDADLVPIERIDAVASLADVSLELADQLACLEPHGLGNPAPRVLLPAVELEGVASLGQEGRHLRFTARSAAGSCRGILFGGGRELARLAAGGRYDVACRIQRNDWNATSAVQLVARAIAEVPAPAEAAGVCLTPCDATCPTRAAVPAPPPPAASAAGGARVHDARGRGAFAELARVVASGDRVLVVCSDVARRRTLLAGAMHPGRYGLRGALLASARCAAPALEERLAALREPGSWLVLADFATLAARPELAQATGRVVVLDPPATALDAAALAALAAPVEVHLVYGSGEVAAAARVHGGRAPRQLCTTVWKALADGAATVAELVDRLAAAARVHGGRGPRQLCTTVWKALGGGAATAAELVDRLAADGHRMLPADLAFALEALQAAGFVASHEDRYLRAVAAAGARLEDLPAYAARLVEHAGELAQLRDALGVAAAAG